MLGGQELLSSIHLRCENFLAKQEMHDCYNAAWIGLEKKKTLQRTRYDIPKLHNMLWFHYGFETVVLSMECLH